MASTADAVAASAAPTSATAKVPPSCDKDCTIVLYQGCSVAGDVTANLLRVTEAVKEAASAATGSHKADVLLFPELFLSGYDAPPATIRGAALHQTDARWQSIASLSKEHSMVIAVPYTEKAPATSTSTSSDSSGTTATATATATATTTATSVVYYNSVALFTPSAGMALHYRKTHLWGDFEKSIFTPGSGTQLGSAGVLFVKELNLTLGLLICYDIEFPEPARCLAVAGAEVLLVPTALGSSGVFDASSRCIIPARAMENSAVVAYCNHVPQAGGSIEFCGLSIVSGPTGDALVLGDRTTTGLLRARYVHHKYDRCRAVNPYLAERRPDCYGEMLKTAKQ